MDCKINKDSRIGIIGFKYFEPEHMKENTRRVDIPSYIMDELTEVVDRESLINFTQSLTHPTKGIRMVIRNPKEIAHFEYACNKTSNCIINILKYVERRVSRRIQQDRKKKDVYERDPWNKLR